MMRKGLFTFVLLTFCLIVLSSFSMAAEYYVSITGSDATGTGSLSNPYRTIQHVLDSVAAPGDILTLRGGNVQRKRKDPQSQYDHSIEER